MKFHATGRYSWTKSAAHERVEAARKKYGSRYSYRVGPVQHSVGRAHRKGYAIFAARKRR